MADWSIDQDGENEHATRRKQRKDINPTLLYLYMLIVVTNLYDFLGLPRRF